MENGESAKAEAGEPTLMLSIVVVNVGCLTCHLPLHITCVCECASVWAKYGSLTMNVSNVHPFGFVYKMHT